MQLISQCQTSFSFFCFTLLITNDHTDTEGNARVKTTRFPFWKVPGRLEVWTDHYSCLTNSIYGWPVLICILRADMLHLMMSITESLHSSPNCWQDSTLQVFSSLNLIFFEMVKFFFFLTFHDPFLLEFNSTGSKIMICMLPLHHLLNCLIWLSIFKFGFGCLPLNSSWQSSVPERNVCNLSKSDLVLK